MTDCDIYQLCKWRGEECAQYLIQPLHFDGATLLALRVQQPKYIIVLMSTHEIHLIHNLKVLAAHSECEQIILATLAVPDSFEELQAFAAMLATELHPVLVEIYPVQMSSLELLEATDEVYM